MREILKISAIVAAVFAYAGIELGKQVRERFVIGMRTQSVVDAIKNGLDCSWPNPSVTTNYTCSSSTIKAQLDRDAKNNETRTRHENPFSGMDCIRWGAAGALVGLSLPFFPDCGNAEDQDELRIRQASAARLILGEESDDDESCDPKDETARKHLIMTKPV